MQVATPPTASEFQGGIIGVTLRPVSGADLISPITALATRSLGFIVSEPRETHPRSEMCWQEMVFFYEAQGPYITIPQYWFNKTKQHNILLPTPS